MNTTNINIEKSAVNAFKYLVDLPLTILKQLLVTLEIEEAKCFLIYTYTVHKERLERYRESANRFKAMLSL